MLFTTFQFLVFFAAFVPLFFVVPVSWRVPLLLAASYYFYMCSIPWYITVIVAITVVDFVAGVKIEDAPSARRKRLYFALSIVSNFGLLFAFKYAGFFATTINAAAGWQIPVLAFVLPLGISFHTFQALSYTIEVYRGRYLAERNLLTYALYVAFFPQMVAGPIERPYNLLPQFHAPTALTFDGIRSGFRCALWGVFKKVVVADLLATAVNTVYASPRSFSGPVLLVATVFFAIQIYCDFSGYSEIAIGIARMMGYRLMINFRQPYFARSIGEFWRRWHISLSSWFRDYVYLPLGGNRVSTARYAVNIMIVFLLSGLWHGANWTFVVWGALHGFYLVFGSLTASARDRIKAALGLQASNPLVVATQVITTFTLATIAWVFFRIPTVHDGLYVVAHLFDWRGFEVNDLLAMGLPRFELALAFAMVGVMFTVEWSIARPSSLAVRMWSSRPMRWTLYNACAFAIIFFGVFGRIEFIYFQF